MLTFEEFRNDIFNNMENKPNWSRKGQFVFNYIDAVYGVARYVQFVEGVDCFYNDNIIDDFIVKAYEKYKEVEND